MTKTANVDTDNLMKLAEMLLDDEGQVAISVLLDEGRVREAQAHLLGTIDRKLAKGRLEPEDIPDLMEKLGLPHSELDRLQQTSTDLWKR